MLVLSRIPRPGQDKIILQTSDGPIEITVCAVNSGQKVSVGLSAPASVVIIRGELLERKKFSDRFESVG